MSQSIDSPGQSARLAEIAAVFARLGVTGFGGPAAHIAMMEAEVVGKRNWISRERFIDYLGLTNLIPGPNSTEMAIHVGYARAGWKGLIVAGLCFILPAVAITLTFAYLYVQYGSTPRFEPFVAGIRPVMIAVIIAAVYRLRAPMVKSSFNAVLAVLVAVSSLLHADELLLLALSGIASLAWKNRRRILKRIDSGAAVIILPLALGLYRAAATPAPEPLSLSGLGFFFLKVGSVLYGSGYVLVAFVQGGLVDVRHWLSQTQLLDAIAVGQFTPGPVLSTATFIGYVLLGVPGAAVATAGIFIPSFVFVAATSPFVPKLRSLPLVADILDGVNAASLGLMIGVSVTLGMSALSGWGPWAIFAASALVLSLWRVNAMWLVAGGAIAGYALAALHL